MKPKYDLIIGVYSCQKYMNTRLKAIKETWLKKLPSNIKYFHIIGDKKICDDKNIHIDFNENIIYCNSDDDYNSLPSKVITTLDGINELFDYKYIFKTDDDQNLKKPNFFIQFPKLILNKDPISHYGGFSIIVNTHISNYYMIHNCLPKDIKLEATTYCNGRFYYLSKSAVENLILKKELIKNRYIEDHAIGYYLDDSFKNNMEKFDSRKCFDDYYEFNQWIGTPHE